MEPPASSGVLSSPSPSQKGTGVRVKLPTWASDESGIVTPDFVWITVIQELVDGAGSTASFDGRVGLVSFTWSLWPSLRFPAGW
jgi:hypothetical protein